MKEFKQFIPNSIPKHSAYLYEWRIRCPKTKRWISYIGRKHDIWKGLDKYTHSSENEEFLLARATSEKQEFHLLNFGIDFDIAVGEIMKLRNAKNSKGEIVGAAASDIYYNRSNGEGGMYGKDALSYVILQELWESLKKVFEDPVGEFLKIGVNCQFQLQMGPTLTNLSTHFLEKSVLEYIIDNGQIIQHRDILFDSETVAIFNGDMKKNPRHDDWPPIVVLVDCKLVDKKLISEKGSFVIISGNHRSRSCVLTPDMVGLNAFGIPSSIWKKLTYNDVKLLSARCNPDPKNHSLEMSPETVARTIIDMATAKKFFKEVNGEQVPDFSNAQIKKEIVEYQGVKTRKYTKAVAIAERTYEQEILLKDGENFVDFSKEGLKNNPKLKEKYDEKVAFLLEDFDWVHKISGQNISLAKIAEHVKKKGFKKKGYLLIHYKSYSHKVSEDCKKQRDNLDQYLEHFIDSSYEITVKVLPLTTGEAKAEGYELD